MTGANPEQQPWGLQAPIFGTAFFNGSAQPMATLIVALLVGSLIGTGHPFLIAVVLASRQVLSVTMSIHGGAMMDRLGTRRVIVVLGVVGALAALSYPLLAAFFGPAPLSPQRVAPVWLFVTAIVALQMISGFTEAICWIGSHTLVARLLNGLPVYTGRMTFAGRLGGVVAPLGAGAAWDGLGPGGGFGFLAAWILCGAGTALLVPASAPGETVHASTAPDARIGLGDVLPRLSSYTSSLKLLLVPAVAMVIAVSLIRQTGAGMQNTFYVVWLNGEIGLSGTAIGALVASANAASALAALSTGVLARRFAVHRVLFVTIGLSIAGVAVTPALGGSYALLMLAISCRGIGQGLNLPLMLTIITRSVPTEALGRMMAMRVSFNRLGSAVFPLVMGALAEFVGIANSFYVLGGVGLALLVLLGVWIARVPAFEE